MRVSRFVALVGLLVLLAPSIINAADVKPPSANQFSEGIKAIESGRMALAVEKLREVLARESDNYEALVLLGQVEMEDLGGADRGRRAADAEYYFLQATIAQPGRAEAYLAMAQLYYNMGYIGKGDRYARTAQDVDRSSYESFCLLGQRYEDSGNYTGALDQYSVGLGYYGFDPYLEEKRYVSASQGGLQPQWVYPVESGRADRRPLLLRKFPDFYLLNQYRLETGKAPEGFKHYTLPFFKFGYCPRESPPVNPYKDLYEAFIKASVTDPREYARVRGELDRIRQEAFKAISGAKDNKAKALALYKWMKANVLKTYDVQQGVLAQGVIEQKKYVSLTGSILYALIASEAGLPVSGVVAGGHAFVRLDDGKRKIPIEMTAGPPSEVPEDAGFDAVWWDQFLLRSAASADRIRGAGLSNRTVSDLSPAALTGFQFLSVNSYNLESIAERYKEEASLKKTLEDQMIQNNRESATRLASIRERYRNEPERMETILKNAKEKFEADTGKLKREIRKIDVKIEQEKAKYYAETGLNLMRAAKALAPRVDDFIQSEEKVLEFIATAEARPVLEAVEERNRKQRELEKKLTEKLADVEVEKALSGRQSDLAMDMQREADEINAAILMLAGEEREGWESVKSAWRKALARLEKSVQERPCSDSLKKRLESFLWLAARQAERANDPLMLKDVIRVGMSRLPGSEFSRQYKEKATEQM